MVGLIAKANAIRRGVSSRIDVADVDVDGDTVEIDVHPSVIHVQGEAKKDLSEVRAAIRKEIEDVVGYDVEFTVLLNVIER